MIKFRKSALNDLDRLTLEAYNYFEKTPTYPIHSNYPQALFDGLKKHYSPSVVSFLQEFHREFTDNKFVIYSADGTENDDFRNIDFKLYKKWISLLFLQEPDANGKVEYPIRNILSKDLATNRIDNQGELLFDNQSLRASIFKESFFETVRDQLKQDGKLSEANTFTTGTNQIWKVLNPVVSFVIKGSIAKSSFPNVEIPDRHLSELRKVIQGTDYDPVNRVKIGVYKDSTQDPITNLSYNDVSSLEYALSGMVDHQVVTYSSKPYVDRDVILSVYITIAVTLVPITYLVVRRQDFR